MSCFMISFVSLVSLVDGRKEGRKDLGTLLNVDPRQRPTIQTLVENLEDLAIGNQIGLNEPLLFLFNANEMNETGENPSFSLSV